ncbi:hypothetical protein [Flavobacterium eburneipallidum]|uniref:hypothetical protein n=1 Tax=Flavobacterium eburneipallidum TaxID=3003263 RepID=UPI00248329EE|nr:hypothetical protein [Flavobacterium eburneipallidum]
MLPAFGNVVIYTNFKINQDEIAKTICIQRKMVNNSCNGRCDLQKSLKQFEDNEKKMDNLLKEKAELVYIQSPTIIHLEVFPLIETTQKQYPTLDKKPISVALSNFRPPTYFI